MYGKDEKRNKNHKIYKKKAKEKIFLLPLCEPVVFGLTTTTNIPQKKKKT